jgi:hypothetical protein
VHAILVVAFIAQASDVSGTVSLANNHSKGLLQFTAERSRKHLAGHKAYFQIEVSCALD